MPRVMRAWHLIPDRKLAIGASAKCGSTALKTELTGDTQLGCVLDGHRVDFSGIPVGYHKVGIVRHPVARQRSLYANIQERERTPTNFYKQFEGKSQWDVFDGIIQAGLGYDVHFHPQWWIGLKNADELVPLEDLSNWWEETFGYMLPVKNDSKGHYPEDPETDARVLSRYQTDLRLWERANGIEQKELSA